MNDKMISFVNQLSPEQIKACECMDNMLLTACPGSGKTRTVAYKLAYLTMAFPNSRRLHVAITFTNRAADEILSRLDDLEIEANNIWAGTIHQFCMEYVIRPYSMYSVRLHKGYHIIDQYVQIEYKREIAHDLGISCYDGDMDKYPKIVQAYKRRLIENKEIDFDDILSISFQMLTKYSFIAENLASLMASIQVDEYQDTNEKQYLIISEICKQDPNIIVSFIGDANQAIYDGLGGVAKTKQDLSFLFHSDFKELHLTGCFRSTQKIIDYYNNYAVKAMDIVSKKDSGVQGIISYSDRISKDGLAEYIAEIVEGRLAKGDEAEEICIVAPQWEIILPMAVKLREILPNVRFDAPDTTPFKYDAMNPFYLLARLTFTRPQGNMKIRKKYAREILEILRDDYGLDIREEYDCFHLLETINSIPKIMGFDGMEIYRETVKKVLSSMDILLLNEPTLYECYKSFLEKADERIYRHKLSTLCDDFYKCFERKKGIVINTIHGIKGEEYNTVIAYGLLEGYIPHWDVIINNPASRKENAFRLLYVLGSRAKENLYLISESGRKTRKNNPYLVTKEIKEVVWQYD